MCYPVLAMFFLCWLMVLLVTPEFAYKFLRYLRTQWEKCHVRGAKGERRRKKYGKTHSALIITSILVLYHVISPGISFITRKEKRDWRNLSFQKSFFYWNCFARLQDISPAVEATSIFVLYPVVLNKRNGVMIKTGSFGVVNFTLFNG
jgi:hypothetical protein